MKIEYLTLERAKELENLIGYLSNYKGSDDTEIMHQIGTSNKIEDMDVYYTKQLKKLGELNRERENILQLFKQL